VWYIEQMCNLDLRDTHGSNFVKKDTKKDKDSKNIEDIYEGLWIGGSKCWE
jgi:hypothetical protein